MIKPTASFCSPVDTHTPVWYTDLYEYFALRRF